MQSVPDVLRWLEKFTDRETSRDSDLVRICDFAFKNRHDKNMERLKNASHKLDPNNFKHVRKLCADLYHNIGRLGCHARVPPQLVRVVRLLPDMLRNFEVKPIQTPSAMRRPELPSETTAADIFQRSLPSNSQGLRMDVLQLHRQTQREHLHIANALFERSLEEYKSSKMRAPVVPHAEIQVLEHFYDNQLDVVGSDPFIGCSKPACYCCHLYFRYHPGGFVEPPGHQNIYFNWVFPRFPSASLGHKAQLAMLKRMTQELGSRVLDRSLKYPEHHAHHLDSTTDITGSRLRANTHNENNSYQGTDNKMNDNARTSYVRSLTDLEFTMRKVDLVRWRARLP